MKEIGINVLILGLLFLVISLLFNAVFKTKKVKLEIEAINKRSMLSAAYTEEIEPKRAIKEQEESYKTEILNNISQDEYKTTLL